MLGMYVHTHWGYNHPYAARTWTLEDWHGYLSGLQKLGYNLVMFWPLADSMPPQPTASDLAFLKRIAQVIDMAHNQFNMKFWITLGPNVMGNEKAANYHYEERPYFICERKVNPADAKSVAELLEARKWQLEPLQQADGLIIIDGDPGGWIGSTDAEFVEMLKGQIGVFRKVHPGAELVYWIWFGWQNYNRFWAEANQLPAGQADPPLHIELPTFISTLNGIKAQIPEPWSLLGAFPQHLEATAATGVGDRMMHIPYGAVEGEPSFPLTNYTPADLKAALLLHPKSTFPRGVMANAQAHCLQLPHTYLFSRWAQDGADAVLDLKGFAEGLIPGLGMKITAGWEAIGSQTAAQQREAARSIWEEIGKPHSLGEYAGFLFGDPDRFLVDLAMNLEVRASLAELQQALDNDRGNLKEAVGGVLKHLIPYQQRLGFTDAYGGPLYQMLNEPLAQLGDLGIDAVLAQFHDWRNPAVRNGVVPRLLEAMASYAQLPL